MADDEDEGQMVDWSNQALWKLDIQPQHADLVTLIADHNCLTKIDNLHKCPKLQQLSLANNRLLHVSGLSSLQHLSVLNLASNSISSIEGLEALTELSWLDLSGNNIKDISSLSKCVKLRHLEVSENDIAELADMRALTALKTFLLHCNSLTSLLTAPQCLPPSLCTLSLESNSIEDLTQVSCLSFLTNLQQLSLASNPCLDMTGNKEGFDYRPYVLCCCPTLRVLDGYIISDAERMLAHWLFSQGFIQQLNRGQHSTLIQYLASVCPLTSTQQLQVEEEARLAGLINKHHPLPAAAPWPQLSDSNATQLTTGERSVESSITASSLSHTADCSYEETPVLTTERTVQPIVSIAFTVDGSSEPLIEKVKRKGHDRCDLSLQDISSCDDFDAHSTTSLLESESVYIPVTAETPQKPTKEYRQRQDTAEDLATVTEPQPPVHKLPLATVVPRPQNTSPHVPTAAGDQENKYKSKEQRVIRPFNQEITKGKLLPSFVATLPLASASDPATHVCHERPLTAASHDYDMSLDASRPSAPAPTSVPAAEVSLIHRVADSKRAAKEQSMRHTPPPRTPPPAAPVTNKGSSKGRMRGLDSNRQAELSKLAKCQRNTEHVNQHHSTTPSNTLGLSSDSGFLSRPASDAILTDYGQEGHAAAVCIQAMWRGYWAREHNIDVVSVRKEIRARRAEDHIVLLRAELDRHRKLYNEEKRLRTLQMEAIRCLYHEVQQLKAQVQQSGLGTGHNNLGHAEVANGLLSSSSIPSTSSLLDSQRTAELERTCASLQSQVSQLQEALQSMTSVVFGQSTQGSVGHGPLTDTDSMRMVEVSECLDADRNQSPADSQGVTCHWSSIPHSLSPYPSEEEENYFRHVPHFGAPTPPRSLSLQHKGEHSVLLRWLPSRVAPQPHKSNGDSKPVLSGYQVFVNDQLKGHISSNQTMALISGLASTATYKFYVKAVSSHGESYESNVVIARLARGSERQQLSDSSDSDVLPDSDKDLDSANLHDKRKLRKRDSRKHRKVRSPRSEKKLPHVSSESTPEVHKEKGKEEKEVGSDVGAQGEEQGQGGILTHPKLHKHRRNNSKEQNELASMHTDSPPLMPSRQELPAGHQRGGVSPVTVLPSRNTPTPTRDLTQTPHTPTSPVDPQQRQSPVRAHHVKSKSPSPSLSRKIAFDRPPSGSGDTELRTRETPTPPVADGRHSSMSDTFTVDSARSILRNLGVATPDISAASGDGRTTPDVSSGKGHSRKSSRDPDASSGGSHHEGHKDRSGPDSGHSIGQTPTNTGEETVKVRTHRRTRSRDLNTPTRELNTPTPMDDAKKDETERSPHAGEENTATGGAREKDRCNTPVLDGRRRSRPSSPVVTETGGERRDTESAERKRIPTAELLEQRLSNIKKSSTTASASRERDGEEGEGRSSASPAQKHSPSSESLHDSSQDETPRPASLRRRTHSMGSESDLPGAAGGSRKEANIVSSLLAKLQVFTRKQESNLKETSSRLRRRSDEDDKPRGGRTRHKSESDNDASSDAGGNLPPRVPVSDSSSGSHSDEGKVARSHRLHHRHQSDQRPLSTSGYSSDQLAGRPTHSPIIMEGASGKKGSSNVRRNASFHALLPSRPPDSQQPQAALEEGAVATSTSISRREEIASPQESQGNPRTTMRSRSPSPNRSRQPVLSGAQLKRQGDPTKPPS